MRVSSVEISSPNFSIGDSDGDSDAEELDVGSMRGSRTGSGPSSSMSGLGLGSMTLLRDQAEDKPLIGVITEEEFGEQGRAFESEVNVEGTTGEGEEAYRDRDLMGVTSPVEKASRAWVEEEAEIFRKGTKLGVADEEEIEDRGDVSGEILRKEVRQPETRASGKQIKCLIPLTGTGLLLDFGYPCGKKSNQTVDTARRWGGGGGGRRIVMISKPHGHCWIFN